MGDGDAGRWQLVLDAPALRALAPLAAMFPAARAWAPLAGTVRADATLQGRWPALQSEGRLAIDGLRAGELQVGTAQAAWRVEGGLAAPLSAEMSVAQARWNGQALQALQARLSGTLAQHRLTVQAAVPLLPPEAIARSLGLTLQRGTRVAVQIDGAWAQDPRAEPLPAVAAGRRPAKGQPPPPAAEPGSRWTGQARIEWPDAGLVAEIAASANLSGYILFSPTPDAGYFCFEPVSHVIDAHNARPDWPDDMGPNGGLAPLAPGATLEGSMSIDVGPLQPGV